MITKLTKGFAPGFIFLGCLMIFSSFFDPARNIAKINLKVVQEDRNLAVSVKSDQSNGNTQFYMFNIEGELVKEFNINGSRKVIIPQLAKGIYVYEFFRNDLRLKNGKIELK